MELNESLFSRNETLENIKNRRSTRAFTDEPVSEKDISTILQAANMAPSAHNQQSWRFVVIRGRKKQDIVNLITAKASDFPRASATLLRMASRTIAGAPVVIAVVNTGELINHGTQLFKIAAYKSYDFFRTMEIQSSAAAVENLMIAATSLGLASVWLGVLLLMKEEVCNLIGEPEGEFMAIIPLGYPARKSAGPKKRSLNMTVKYMD
jgi:nitroreductase